ncbi:MAG: 30S ribosomal protein S17 [Bacteroidota bacterium]|nr:MAG: 30S ribosomal protein S17 [Bacteroidota bacterium]
METRNLRKERVGVVVRTKWKSLSCSEVKSKTSDVWKICIKNKKYVVHDDKNDCNIGDTVKIMETRPLSKSKCWRMVEIIERAK